MSRVKRREEKTEKRAHDFFWLFLFLIGLFSSLFLLQCRNAPLIILPSPMERMEGYASLSLSGSQGSAKSKFSFLLELPRQGQIEVFDLLGRTVYRLLIEGSEAYFILPSKKVYWQGGREEIIEKFLGFALSPEEIGSLLSGQWKRRGIEEGKWNIERDEKDRVVAASRNDLRFEIRQFFPQSPVARLVFFRHSLGRGRLKILNIKFNQPLKEAAFSLSFLQDFAPCTWEEIERMLGNEN